MHGHGKLLVVIITKSTRINENLMAVLTLLLLSVVTLVISSLCSWARLRRSVFAANGSISEDDFTFQLKMEDMSI